MPSLPDLAVTAAGLFVLGLLLVAVLSSPKDEE
jgi:hypothetical protein